MTTRGMWKQPNPSGDMERRPQQKNATKSGKKRSIDEAFPEYHGSGTKVLSNNAIPV